MPINIFTTVDDPLAPGSTQASGINDMGQIVGTYFDAHGFLYGGGSYTTIDDPLATQTVAQGINNAGQIVGYYSDQGGVHGYLLVGGLYAPIDNPSSTNGTFAQGINAAGQIVGWYLDASDTAYGFRLADGLYALLQRQQRARLPPHDHAGPAAIRWHHSRHDPAPSRRHLRNLRHWEQCDLGRL